MLIREEMGPVSTTSILTGWYYEFRLRTEDVLSHPALGLVVLQALLRIIFVSEEGQGKVDTSEVEEILG